MCLHLHHFEASSRTSLAATFCCRGGVYSWPCWTAVASGASSASASSAVCCGPAGVRGSSASRHELMLRALASSAWRCRSAWNTGLHAAIIRSSSRLKQKHRQHFLGGHRHPRLHLAALPAPPVPLDLQARGVGCGFASWLRNDRVVSALKGGIERRNSVQDAGFMLKRLLTKSPGNCRQHA